MELAVISVLMVWGSTAAMLVALVAFAIDLARSADRRRVAVASDAEREATSLSQAARASSRSAVARTPRTRATGIGYATSWLGALLLLVAIAMRGASVGRAPWANMYEFALVATLSALAAFLIVSLRREVRFLGVFIAGAAVLAMVSALHLLYIDATGLQPALQSNWLIVHVGVAVVSTGIFSLAALIAGIQLIKDSRDAGRLATRPWRWLDAVPGVTALDALSFRLNAVGFVLWTLTIIGGAIWAEQAWGRYWGWDPKEIWSFVIWIAYSIYLHARTTRGWDGRKSAYLCLVGCACLLFNFTGVNLLFDGKHSYTGL